MQAVSLFTDGKYLSLKWKEKNQNKIFYFQLLQNIDPL